MAVKDILKEYIDVKPLVNLVITLAVTAAGVGYFSRDYVDTFKQELKKEIVVEIKSYLDDSEDARRLPAYVTLQYDLLKQLDKLTQDPDDVKFTDIEKFLYFCEKDTYFINVFIPQSDRSRALELSCIRIKEEYDRKYNFAYGGGK